MSQINNGLREADKYLALMQNSFNITNKSYKDIIYTLDIASEIVGNDSKKRKEALDLKRDIQTSSVIKMIDDELALTRFDSIMSNLDINTSSITDVIKANELLIKDINTSRNWLDKYNKFLKTINYSNKYSMKNLIVLGTAILGRSLELCPIDKGTLRRSAIMITTNNSIIIAYTAPYATYVHENMSINHKNHKDGHECGGEAKFLEKAGQEFIPDKTVWVDNGGFGDVRLEIDTSGNINYYHYDGGML